MCGRYTQTKDFYQVRLRFDVDAFEREIVPRYNIAPNQQTVVVVSEGKR
ncbi:MAG: SOS response-associated peptidase family protein, partial [Candidatus Omnitrophica bacterium]|nr:SOS response-associated peptidase family protein [Candidatus Omnitrophota bacterium]